MRTACAVVAVVLASATACGTRARSSSAWGPDGKHATAPAPDADAGAAAATLPAVSGAEARDRYRAALAGGQWFQAVVFANRYASGGDALGDDAGAIVAAVDRLDADLLAAAWGQLDPGVAPAGWVALRLALVARHSGDGAGALEWIERVATTSPARERAAALAANIGAAAVVDPATIAVLLPLSGRFEPIGRELEVAIRLAGTADRGAKLVVIDTAGEPETARAAVDTAVRGHGAVAILGPVGQRTGRAAAVRAVELGVPIALLSPGRGSAAVDVGVFRLWPSAVWIAEAAALVAVRRGYDALAILAPRDEFGAATTRAFRDAAIGAGARVVAVGEYDPTATELEPDLKEFLNLVPARNQRLRQHLRARGVKAGWKSFSPDVAFDLLYVPDEYQRAALVASYLPFFNVEVRTSELMDPLELRRKHGGRLPSFVQLMGSPGWHHPGLFARGGRAVEGALVVDVCAGGDAEEFATDGAAEFAERFRRRRKRAPTPAAAQAYDAALLVMAARRAVRPDAKRPRERMVDALAGAAIDDGACGRASVGAGGEIERDPIVLRVDGGEFTVDR